MCRIECGHPGIFLVDVVSKSFPDVVKIVKKRENSRVQTEVVRCDTVPAKSAEIHDTRIRPRGCVAARSMMVARAHTYPAQCNAAAEQQPEVPGYRWAPQWVPARTPMVHWGPISGKAVGGPNHS